MHTASRFLVWHFIFIFLVLGSISRAVSDFDIFANDFSANDLYADNLYADNLYTDDTGTDYFLDDPDGSSPLDQFTNDVTNGNDYFANDFLADNLVVDDIQSCRQPGRKLKARGSDGQFCTGSDAPAPMTLDQAGDKLLTKTEVQKYWCSKFIKDTPGIIPVCSSIPMAESYSDAVEGYLSSSWISPFPPHERETFVLTDRHLVTPVSYIICGDDSAYCCHDWFGNRILSLSTILVSNLREECSINGISQN